MVIRINKKLLLVCFMACLTLLSAYIITTDKEVLADNLSEGTEIPIIMYHHVTEDPKRSNNYTVTSEELEKDFLYLKNKGYNTVTTDMLVDYVENGVPLPDNPIMLTFDDGFESFYVLAYPLLKKYNYKAVLSVIGSVTEKYTALNDHNINYSNLTWDEIKEMHNSGYVEIQSHSYDMHHNESGKRKGVSALKYESYSEYRKAIGDDLIKMNMLLKDRAGITVTAIAYPFGAYSKDTVKVIKSLGFKASFSCEERISFITVGSKDSLYNLGRFNRMSGVSSENFFTKILHKSIRKSGEAQSLTA